MEMEGRRGYSDLLRNCSEEIVLKSLMENPIGISAPSMEMLGLKNISQTLRVDSEELFNSWLMNGEIPGFNSSSHRTWQASQRISTELSAFSSQQNGVGDQKKSGNDHLFHQNLSTPDAHPSNISQHSLRNAAEKGMEASNLYLAKAWFQSTQPMTRSRSSELRRRYAATQNFQTTVAGAPVAGCGTNQIKQELTDTNTISSVVSMLKGTLERKKLGDQVDKETLKGSSFGFYNAQEVPAHLRSDQFAANQVVEPPRTFHVVSHTQVSGNSASVERSAELNMEGFVTPANQIQMSTMSREPSQSESSAAAPAVSTCFEVCDDSSAQAFSACESSRKHLGNGTSDHGSKAKEFRDRIFKNNLKNDRKKGSLGRMGSVSSGGSVDKGDPTKKRRVERSCKMAEAKERSSTPTLPSNMQSVLKRRENLEKEVRSLKLNLSFMNRKDSEQTKHIEDLQKQNDKLMEEKERLLEEIKRIISEPGGMCGSAQTPSSVAATSMIILTAFPGNQWPT